MADHIKPVLPDDLVDTTNAVVAGRKLGIVLRDVTRDKGFLFLTDGGEIEYFAHKTGFVSESLFYTLSPGKPVSFRVAKTTKGFRAHDIREADEAEAATLVDLITDRLAAAKAVAVRDDELKGEDRGNR